MQESKSQALFVVPSSFLDFNWDLGTDWFSDIFTCDPFQYFTAIYLQYLLWKYTKHPICDIYAFGDIEAFTKEVLTENAFKAWFCASLLCFESKCSHGKVSDFYFEVFVSVSSEFGFQVVTAVLKQFLVNLIWEGKNLHVELSFILWLFYLKRRSNHNKRDKARKSSRYSALCRLCVSKRDCIRCHFTESELVFTCVLNLFEGFDIRWFN